MNKISLLIDLFILFLCGLGTYYFLKYCLGGVDTLIKMWIAMISICFIGCVYLYKTEK